MYQNEPVNTSWFKYGKIPLSEGMTQVGNLLDGTPVRILVDSGATKAMRRQLGTKAQPFRKTVNAPRSHLEHQLDQPLQPNCPGMLPCAMILSLGQKTRLLFPSSFPVQCALKPIHNDMRCKRAWRLRPTDLTDCFPTEGTLHGNDTILGAAEKFIVSLQGVDRPEFWIASLFHGHFVSLRAVKKLRVNSGHCEKRENLTATPVANFSVWKFFLSERGKESFFLWSTKLIHNQFFSFLGKNPLTGQSVAATICVIIEKLRLRQIGPEQTVH